MCVCVCVCVWGGLSSSCFSPLCVCVCEWVCVQERGGKLCIHVYIWTCKSQHFFPTSNTSIKNGQVKKERKKQDTQLVYHHIHLQCVTGSSSKSPWDKMTLHCLHEAGLQFQGQLSLQSQGSQLSLQSPGQLSLQSPRSQLSF